MTTAYCLDPQVAKVLNQRLVLVAEALRGQTPETEQELVPQVPSVSHIHALIDVAFWASLRREEGRHHKFSLTFLPPTQGADSYLFQRPVPFDSDKLAKLSPALHKQRTSMGVWPDGDKLAVWGFTQSNGWFFSVEVFEPGQLLTSFRYQGRALVTGSKIQFIDSAKFTVVENIFAAMRSSHKAEIEFASEEFFTAMKNARSRQHDFVEVAKAMLAHVHGGTLLIVAKDKDVQASIDFGSYTSQPFEGVKNEVERRNDIQKEEKSLWSPKSSEFWRAIDSARDSLKFLGQLTSVDGATVITYDLTVLAFGAKIKPLAPDDRPEIVLVSEPFEESDFRAVSVSNLGWGTRHLSAAQFVYDQKDSIALVASQDGKLSVFVWDFERQRVVVVQHIEIAFR